MTAGGAVETVQRALEAWARRDSAAIRDLFDEQAEFRSAIVGGVEGGVYRGHDDIQRYFADLDDSFENWHTEAERYFELGGGGVLLLYRIVGQGKASGVPVDHPVGIVFTVRSGRVVRGEVHLDPQDALRTGFAHSFSLFGAEDLDGAVSGMDPTSSGSTSRGRGHRRRASTAAVSRFEACWSAFAKRGTTSTSRFAKSLMVATSSPSTRSFTHGERSVTSRSTASAST